MSNFLARFVVKDSFLVKKHLLLILISYCEYFEYSSNKPLLYCIIDLVSYHTKWLMRSIFCKTFTSFVLVKAHLFSDIICFLCKFFTNLSCWVKTPSTIVTWWNWKSFFCSDILALWKNKEMKSDILMILSWGLQSNTWIIVERCKWKKNKLG